MSAQASVVARTFAAFAAATLMTSAISTPSNVAVAAEPLDGKTLFRAKCGMCHLQGGTGTFMLGRRLGQPNALLESRTNLDAALVKTVARNGIVSMPRFNRAELSDAELEAIAQYLARAK